MRNSNTRENFLLWFIQEFGFNANATTALYNVQMLKDTKTLSELDNDAIANICKAVSKDTGQSVSKIAATKLKLTCFWIRHQHRTLREIAVTSRPLVMINYSGAIELLRQQKQDEDNWATNNKELDYPLLTLDTSTATRVFDKVKTLLGQVRGFTGVPLVYVIRVALVPEDENDNPPFGDEETKYTSIDMEMIARTPILSNDADIYGEDSGNLKAHGPFVPTFPTDTKNVWAILLACFGLSSAWQHVKKFANQQNGCQAWHTLHDHFFGGDKVNTMVADILSTLKTLHYGGDWRNFTFDKFCTAHVDRHNRYAALAKWNVPPFEETMKIHYFEDGITDPSFAAVKSTILVDRTRFQNFESVMRVYVNFKRSQKAEAPAQQVRNVSALQGRGGGRQGRGGRGRGGRGGPGGRLNGGIPQEEVDKMTTVEA